VGGGVGDDWVRGVGGVERRGWGVLVWLVVGWGEYSDPNHVVKGWVCHITGGAQWASLGGR